MNHPWWRHGLERLSRITRPCITSATRRCCTNLSQWQRSFHWKLRCHWLKGVLLSDRWNTRSWSFVRHDDVIKWKYFPSSCPFVGGIHRSSVNSPHKGQWHGALMFSLICDWTSGRANHRDAGDLRRIALTVMWTHQSLVMLSFAVSLLLARTFEQPVINDDIAYVTSL